MSVVVLDGATIRDFVNDEAAFNRAIEERFDRLDTDKDGQLTHAEMKQELSHLRVFESHFGVDGDKLSDIDVKNVYDSMFPAFDGDGDDMVDLEDFREGMRKVMLAVAAGIGFPVQMALEEDSFLLKAVERESGKLATAADDVDGAN